MKCNIRQDINSKLVSKKVIKEDYSLLKKNDDIKEVLDEYVRDLKKTYPNLNVKSHELYTYDPKKNRVILKEKFIQKLENKIDNYTTKPPIDIQVDDVKPITKAVPDKKAAITNAIKKDHPETFVKNTEKKTSKPMEKKRQTTQEEDDEANYEELMMRGIGDTKSNEKKRETTEEDDEFSYQELASREANKVKKPAEKKRETTEEDDEFSYQELASREANKVKKPAEKKQKASVVKPEEKKKETTQEEDDDASYEELMMREYEEEDRNREMLKNSRNVEEEELVGRTGMSIADMLDVDESDLYDNIESGLDYMQRINYDEYLDNVENLDKKMKKSERRKRITMYERSLKILSELLSVTLTNEQVSKSTDPFIKKFRDDTKNMRNDIDNAIANLRDENDNLKIDFILDPGILSELYKLQLVRVYLLLRSNITDPSVKATQLIEAKRLLDFLNSVFGETQWKDIDDEFVKAARDHASENKSSFKELYNRAMTFDDNRNTIMQTYYLRKKEFLTQFLKSTGILTARLDKGMDEKEREKALHNLVIKMLESKDVDIDKLSAYLLPPGETFTDSTHTLELVQIMTIILNDNIEQRQVPARDFCKRVRDILDDLNKTLKDKKRNYTLFQKKTNEGLTSENLISRQSSLFDMFFNTTIEHAKRLALSKFTNKKLSNIIEAHTKVYEFFDKSTISVDIRKVPEIINDPEFSIYASEFSKDEKEISDHVALLKKHLGEKGYQVVIAEQKEKLRTFTASVALKQQIEEDASKDASEANIDEIEKAGLDITEGGLVKILTNQEWHEKYDPFVYLIKRDAGIDYFDLENTVSEVMPGEFNTVIPIRYDENDRETGFYDKDYELVENDETLFTFYNMILEVTKDIYESLSEKDKKGFSIFSIPFIEKMFSDLMMDEDIGLREKLGSWAKSLYLNMTDGFYEKIDNGQTMELINPLTGKRIRTNVSAYLLKTNKEKIMRAWKLEMTFVQVALHLEKNKKINMYDTVDIKDNGEVYVILADLYDIRGSVSDFFKDYDFKKFPIGKVIYDGIADRFVKESSPDMPRILTQYAIMMAEFKARRDAMPILSLLKDSVDEKPVQLTTKAGTPLKSGRFKVVGDFRDNGRIQLEEFFHEMVIKDLRQRASKDGKNSPGLRDPMLNRKLFRPSEETTNLMLAESLRLMINRGTANFAHWFKRRYSAQEKILRRYYLECIDKIDDKLPLLVTNESMSKKQAAQIDMEANALKDMKEQLEIYLYELGSETGVRKILGQMMKIVVLLRLGWNAYSTVKNVTNGIYQTMLNAQKSKYFNKETAHRAFYVVTNSVINFWTLGYIDTKEGKKMRNVLSRMNLLENFREVGKNVIDNAQANTVGSRVGTFFSPFHWMKSAEYFNQSINTVAILMDREIKDRNGIYHSLWDAYGEDGRLKNEFLNVEDNNENYDDLQGEAYLELNRKIKQANSETHGNYNLNDLLSYLKEPLIRSMMTFKRYFPETAKVQVQPERYDYKLRKTVKGYYRSSTPFTTGLVVTAGLMSVSALIPTFLGLSIPIGFAAATGVAAFGVTSSITSLKKKSDWFIHKDIKLIQELTVCAQIMLNRIIFLANISLYPFGKKRIGEVNERYGNLSDLDIIGYNRIINSLITVAQIALFKIGIASLKGMFDEDDEDKKAELEKNRKANKVALAILEEQMKTRDKLYNVVTNVAGSFFQEIEGVNTPFAILNIIQQAPAIASQLKDIQTLLGVGVQEEEGKSIYMQGYRRGDSKRWTAVKKLIFPSVFPGEAYGEVQFEKNSPYNILTLTDEKRAQTMIGQLRAEFANSIAEWEQKSWSIKGKNQSVAMFMKKYTKKPSGMSYEEYVPIYNMVKEIADNFSDNEGSFSQDFLKDVNKNIREAHKKSADVRVNNSRDNAEKTKRFLEDNKEEIKKRKKAPAPF